MQPHQQVQSRADSPFLGGSEHALIQELLHPLLRRSNSSLARIEPLSLTLYPVYIAHLLGGPTLLVKFAPAISARLLRTEQRGLDCELLALQAILSQTTLPVPRLFGPDEVLGVSPTSPTFPAPLTHTIWTCPPGTALSSLLPPEIPRPTIPVPGTPMPGLPSTFLATLHRTLGAALRDVVRVRPGDPGTWGLIAPRRGSASSFGAFEHTDGSGAAWRAAFLAMMEASLRDAEDSLVSIPYDAIRVQVARHSSSLEFFRGPPALVPLDLPDATNVFVDERTGEVTGLAGVGPCVWGDFRVGRWFVDWASFADFQVGFGKVQNEHDAGERTRDLLYAVFRSLTAINRQYYRPDDDTNEFGARKSLTWALNQLADLT